MKRKTLDILVGLGLVALAGLLLIAGLVLTSHANFANDYVKDQLSQQQITFKTVDKAGRGGEAVSLPGPVRRAAADHRQAGRVLRQ